LADTSALPHLRAGASDHDLAGHEVGEAELDERGQQAPGRGGRKIRGPQKRWSALILSPFVLHESVTALQEVGVLCGLVAVLLLSI